jgi:predicted Zn-dependent protease
MDNGFMNDLSDMDTEGLNVMGSEVSLSEEVDVGKQLYDGCKEEYRFVYDNRYRKIQRIKNKLARAIDNPRGFNYKIYMIDDKSINAFTAGGYIFVTTAMYEFVNSEDEMACVIGHEMAHNECNHINLQLKREKLTKEVFGDIFGDAAQVLAFVLTTPFNQKKETECDFHGIDYAVTAGYNSCEVIGLWQRMSEMDGEENEIDGMLRTHPYSSTRSSCCRNHIESNYSFNCK